MKLQKRQIFVAFLAMSMLAIVNCSEVEKELPSNHKESVTVPSAANLAMEARDNQEGIELEATQGKSSISSIYAEDNEKILDKPVIHGSTSKVAIVYSERKPEILENKNIKKNSQLDDRNWRIVKASARDSYLDALTHSHSSKDPREGIVRVDTKPKITKLIRREYSEGPVYRPAEEQYGTSKNKNTARISYDGPTQEPFLPTPSDAYSLPVQSSVNFNNHESYSTPQYYHGPPTVPETNYGTPSHSYGPPSHSEPSHAYGPPSFPQNSYGPPSHPQNSYGPPSHPQNSYGPPSLPHNSYRPPSNGYPSAGSAQQAYGSPSPVYGAPHAIQDFSQNLPSLPSLDFFWPFALKLNAFTIAKILLKLVIFKMIVKFIAVICLLLFIPKLEIIKKGDKDEADGDGDDGRKFLTSDSTLERLNILTAFVTSSIEKYEKTKESTDPEDCTNFSCRMKKLIKFENSWNDYVRLFKSYVSEEIDNTKNRGIKTNEIAT